MHNEKDKSVKMGKRYSLLSLDHLLALNQVSVIRIAGTAALKCSRFSFAVLLEALQACRKRIVEKQVRAPPAAPTISPIRKP